MPKLTSETFYATIKNVGVALAISIVMLNLGAALGMLSGRGVVAGVLSAGVISIITSLFSGARVQGSGLTAPMSAITAVIIAKASETLLIEHPDISIGVFVNIVLIEMGVILVICGLLRLGRFIRYVPQLVVAGFMSGIALMIWFIQIELLFGINRPPINGSLLSNSIVLLLTLSLCFIIPAYMHKGKFKFMQYIPTPLVALVVVSFIAYFLNLNVGYLSVESTIGSLSDLTALLSSQLPINIPPAVWVLALPYALQLAALCYIDTLLTALIISKMRSTDGKYSRDLIAQGLSNGALSLIGGVPGAQSTVPSVLLIKEGATQRFCGVLAGVFVLCGALMFTDLLNHIPTTVFAAILIKVGCDIFDFKTVLGYVRTLKKKFQKKPHKILGHREMMVFSGTAMMAAFVDLIVSVAIFSALFHLIKRFRFSKRKITDYTVKR